MQALITVIRTLMACAAFGVLGSLSLAIISAIRAIHGVENHVTGDQLLMAFFIGCLIGVPAVILWGRRKKCKT